MRDQKALVVFSGGQDSTTCLAQAVCEYGGSNVVCLTFQYGQRHRHEVEVARKIADHFRVGEHKVISLDWYKDLTRNALLNHDVEIAKGEGGACPNTVVDGRNMQFLLIAAIYAKHLGIRDIFTGVCQTDFSGYPDCRDVFIKSCNVTLNLAMDYEFRIVTPLMFLTKEETWALADRLGVLDYVAENTLTCYNGIVGRGCGTCPSCLLRQRGYDAYLKNGGRAC